MHCPQIQLRIGTRENTVSLVDTTLYLGHDGKGIGLTSEARASIKIESNARGVWLHVLDKKQQVHVNGRPVYALALLRQGDCIHVNSEMLELLGRNPEPVRYAQAQVQNDGDICLLLRGVGGVHHGRAFALHRPCMIGRSARADIVIDSDEVAAEQISISFVEQGQALLRQLSSGIACLVNGHPVKDVLLNAGDQIVLAGTHRFVLEAPLRPVLENAQALDDGEQDDEDDSAVSYSNYKQLQWVLVVAMLLSLALTFVLFGWG